MGYDEDMKKLDEDIARLRESMNWEKEKQERSPEQTQTKKEAVKNTGDLEKKTEKEEEYKPQLTKQERKDVQKLVKKMKTIIRMLEKGTLAKTEQETRERLINGIILHQEILIIEDEEDGQPLNEKKLRTKTTQYLINTTKEILNALEEIA